MAVCSALRGEVEGPCMQYDDGTSTSRHFEGLLTRWELRQDRFLYTL